MKKTHDDTIFLCSDRTDRKIPEHLVSGNYYTTTRGFTIFELDQPKRFFDNKNITISEGCFLQTEENCYKITSISISNKRPKKLVCKTVKTASEDIPYYTDFNSKKRTCRKKEALKTA